MAEQRKHKVLITVPNGEGWLHKHVVFALMRLQGDQRVEGTFMLPTHKPVENNLAHIQRDFLAGNYEWWLSIDDDNPPIKNPFDLLQLDLDIVGCPTPVWHNAVPGDQPWYYNAVDAAEGGFKPHMNTDGLQEVDAVGGGCILVHRRVVEALKDDMPFQRTWNPDGTVDMGWDYAFCSRAKRKGFRVWAHFGYPCLHFNELELTEAIGGILSMRKA